MVEVGLEILKAEGLTAVTLGAVGKRLGLHKAALYTYVQSKDDLLLAMRDEIHRRHLAALGDDHDVSPDVALKALCTSLLDNLTEYGQLLLAVEPDVSGPGLEVSERFLDILSRLGLDPDQQLRVYLLLAGFLFSTLGGTRSPVVPEEPDDLPHVRAVIHGVEAAAATSARLVEDVVALVIDVLIPALRTSAGGDVAP